MESTTERIQFARKEQLAARSAGNGKLEEAWSETLDRLLDIQLKEMELNANS